MSLPKEIGMDAIVVPVLSELDKTSSDKTSELVLIKVL